MTATPYYCFLLKFSGSFLWLIPCKCYVYINKKNINLNIINIYIFFLQAIVPTKSTQSSQTITTSQETTKQTQTIQTPDQQTKIK